MTNEVLVNYEGLSNIRQRSFYVSNIKKEDTSALSSFVNVQVKQYNNWEYISLRNTKQ